MKINEDKCHLIVSTNELTEIQIREFSIKNSGSEKLLGFSIDSKLNFDCLVNHLCSKGKKKLRVLARVKPYMTLEKQIVMNLFFNTTGPLFRCLTIVKIITKSNICMNDVYD